MTLAIIISPYNAPTPEARAANVRLGIALARWAAAQGYTPVGWWCDIDPANPESDADPVARAAALARSAERARMVGAAGGVAVVPGWIHTAGMVSDYNAWRSTENARAIDVDCASLAPYLLPEPVPTVPRAAVQAAMDEVGPHRGCDLLMGAIRNHTGVTPSEVTP